MTGKLLILLTCSLQVANTRRISHTDTFSQKRLDSLRLKVEELQEEIKEINQCLLIIGYSRQAEREPTKFSTELQEDTIKLKKLKKELRIIEKEITKIVDPQKPLNKKTAQVT